MKILMFGWEFPPHISGGLGTACYGLSKGLSSLTDTDIVFVVPRAWGDEHPEGAELIGANQVPVVREWINLAEKGKMTELIGISSELVPYITPDDFWRLKSQKYESNTAFVEVTDSGTLEFSGDYGHNLYQEIRKFALVAGVIAQEKEIDLVHAHDWMAFPAGIKASKITGKPLVVHVHSTEFDRSGGNVNPTVYAIEREGMDFADKVVAVSNLTRQTIIEKYHIAPGKVVTVYNGIEPRKLARGTKFEKKHNEKTVTFLGRITYQKGPEYFIEAANLVLRKLKNVRFVMAGSGDLMDQMIEQCARLGISDKFYFTGFLEQQDADYLLSISDVCVMPSVSEPFGIVPLEAMQAGVPVIISKQSGVAEIVHYAVKIDFWDTYALADTIHGLLQYPALSGVLRKSGKVEVDHLQWTHSAKQIRHLYNQVTESHKPQVSQA